MYRVGVFDSGVGGRSVANAIQIALPNVQVTFVNDSKNVPYGTKSPEVLLALVLPILQDLARKSDVIVIACNTVSTTLIEQLRMAIELPIIPVVPMLEDAVRLSKTTTIAVCATPTTLASEHYNNLKATYANTTTVLEPDCSEWALMIENDQVDRHIIYTQIDEACKMNADVIVLGCTHYHWIEDLIKETANGRATILQPEPSVVAEVKQALAQLA
jgi:glutamate racemase